ncbi:putative tyrosine protein phosphatase [Maudiozyma humilis]|uniref:M-phase inducer phosphatase n=1 Tax=Maudiozyma humilis TaxID=51915 RepID=A0AAV5S673_MAUHU|nr:putative tyrosine protein phosphatase [Kazachstania humilis]
MDQAIESAVKDETGTLQRMSLGSPFNKRLFKNMHTLFWSSESPKSPTRAQVTEESVSPDSTEHQEGVISPCPPRRSGITDHATDKENASTNNNAKTMSPLNLHIDEDVLMQSPTFASPSSGRASSRRSGSRSRSRAPQPFFNNGCLTSPTVLRRQSSGCSSSGTGAIHSRNNSLGLHRTDSIKKKVVRNSSVKRLSSLYSGKSHTSRGSEGDLKFVAAPNFKLPPQPHIPTYLTQLELSNIPTSESKQSHDSFRRISQQTLRDIITKRIFRPQYDDFTIIDCRFGYEYAGGHIRGAINCCNVEELEQQLLRPSDTLEGSIAPRLLIFHCEFSEHRGPKLAAAFRNHDRIANHDHYPKLYYPDIVVLDGGYKEFYEANSDLCIPINYVRMDSEENLADRDEQMDKFRRDSKRVVTRSNSQRPLIISGEELTEPLSSNNSRSGSGIFRPDPPPRLFSQHLDNPHRRAGSRGSSDETCSSSLTSTSSNISISQPASDPYFSFEENDEIQSPFDPPKGGLDFAH